MKDTLIKMAFIYGFTKNSRAFYDLTIIDSLFKISFITFSSPTNHIAFTTCETKLKFGYFKKCWVHMAIVIVHALIRVQQLVLLNELLN